MFKLSSVLMDENDGDFGFDGAGGEELGGEPSGEPDGSEPESLWLRDLDEDTAYNTLRSAQQFPDHLRGLESRFFGRLGPITEKLTSLEKSLSSRVAFDSSKVKAALDAYDESGTLSSSLIPALEEALNVNPLDENTIRPFIDPVQQEFKQELGEALVLSHYSAEEISDIIPEVADGRWNPQSQRHKDFITWYSQQGFEKQQALNEFGPRYIHALRTFERWEKDRNKEREKAAGDSSSRLAGGQQPSSQGRRPRKAGPQTPEEAFLAGYNEVD